ncbi:MAG TPA: hypothetical protein PKL49_03490 [Steroidobacteraceae bacterium]|nr:hypothetical protein [Steroidobacteraceae bacterium]HNS28551.1 hypothetical protein [Steroidobacteraceae bacterium]
MTRSLFMMTRNFSLIIAVALVALPVTAAEPARWVLEQAVEAEAGSVLLPSGETGMIVVTSCEGCTPQSFVTTGKTRYLADGAPLALRDLRAGLASARHATVTVLYDSRTREVTRVIANGLPR